MLKSMWRRISECGRMSCDILFPPYCLCCGEELPSGQGGILFCSSCADALGPRHLVTCRRCGAAVPPDLPTPSQCIHCRRTRLPLDGVVSLGRYHGELRRVVLKM